jgi:hypothetical protein
MLMKRESKMSDVDKSMPMHTPINIAVDAIGKAHRGEESQAWLNSVMQGLQKRMGLTMDQFLKTEAGKLFLQPARADLATRIELRKAQVEPGREEPYDKERVPNVHMDDNSDREGDADADELMKLALSKLGGGKTLSEAMDEALRSPAGKALMEASKGASLARYY